MKLFEVLPSELRHLQINATHKWSMPGIHCTWCGNVWANTGLSYPCLDISDQGFSDEPYRSRKPVDPDRFTFLKNQIVPLLPKSSLLLPGAQFGHLTGNVYGTGCYDFEWVNSWTLLANSNIIGEIKEFGVKLPLAADTELFHKSGQFGMLLEFQLEAIALLDVSEQLNITKPCDICDYHAMVRPRHLTVQNGSIPDYVDLFKASNLTTLILAKERFRNAILRLGYKGIDFQEVQIGG